MIGARTVWADGKTGVKVIDEYIAIVRSGEYPVCEEQLKLCELVEQAFKRERLYVDEDQLARYLSYEKYFPFELFPWERFCFALHNCTYREDGALRFPILFIKVGRGAGKNGYLGFEDFCLLTDTNGIQEYNIDIFATSEDQARQSFDDVYNVLEANKKKMSKHFKWTLEKITNTDTNSVFRSRTSNAKTKDGGRPGKVDFDELHAYEDYKLMTVATTGLGKKRHPRQTIITTDGEVRGGPLDDWTDNCMHILDGDPDNGILPFIAKLGENSDVSDERSWHEPNPSLRYLPDLLQQMRLEYAQYKLNPANNTAFITKRMNRPPKILENGVTEWENILATNRPIDEAAIRKRPCVAGIDYMKTTDFLGAGLLWRVGDEDIWLSHTWVCSRSADLPRIKAPLRQWEAQGLLTFIDAPEIPPDIPAIWLATEAAKRGCMILRAGIDNYRFTLMKNALAGVNLSDENKRVKLIRPSDEMKHIPIITAGFASHRYVWGDSPPMRWCCNNSKTITSAAGNTTYGKIEPKSRKTDTFKAFVAAEIVSDVLDVYTKDLPSIPAGVYTY